MSDVAVAEQESEKVYILPPKRFRESEFVHGRWNATLPEGVPFDALLNPAAWAHNAHRLKGDPMAGSRPRVDDIIEVRTDDRRFFAELYVMSVRDQSIYVAVIREPVLLKVAKTEKESFSLRWNVGAQGYDIIRQSDKAIVANIPTKEEAAKHIEAISG